MRLITIISILLSLSSIFSAFIPSGTGLYEKGVKGWETESDRPEGNFILDIVESKNTVSEPDTLIFSATGAGFSTAYNTLDDISELIWRNSYVGHGGSSAIAVDRFSNIWMTTAADSFIADVDEFLPVGSGVHMSPDSGKTWTHFPQPGITPVQGLAYDIACDGLGGVWMACFGQSIQKSDDAGQTWRTLTCDHKEWSPINYMNQRMFSVHITVSGNLWVGTAEGVNLCTEYNTPDSLREWKQFTYADGLTGNFVTAVKSLYDQAEGKEYVYAATWLAESSAESNGVSYTSDNGASWNKCLTGEKIYNFGFSGTDVYACGDNGLFKSADRGNYWEKYVIRAWSDIKKDYVDVGKVYSFLYQNSIMFVGTGQGMAVSEDNGNTWYMIEAYEPSSDSSNDTYAYPNPFSPQKFGEVKIQFKLNKNSQVTCEIFNFAMEKVRTVISSEYYEAGESYMVWDGKDSYGKTVANGVYYYIIRYDDEKVWNKIIIFE